MVNSILVTGASGTIGSGLVEKLARHGNFSVRGLVRTDEKAVRIKQLGASSVIGSYEDSASIEAAVADIDTVVLITAAHQDAAEHASSVIRAAKATHVKKIVRVSALKASLDGPTDNTRLHARTEFEIVNSDLAYTILRPHFFMQNLFSAADSIAGQGNFYFGMGDGKMGMIDKRDIVDCAAACALSDAHDGQVIELTGAKSITFYDAASILSEVLGRTITYISVPPDAVFKTIHDAGWGDWMAEVMRDYAQAYSEGWGDFITDGVGRITGHPARSLAAFTREVFAPTLAT